MDQTYLTEARDGNVYHAHNTTAGIVTDISTTLTGLVLVNPWNSGKELTVVNMSVFSVIVHSVIPFSA